MKKPLIAFALVVLFLGSSCVGSYNAFRGVSSWNTRATDSRWWNEVINLGLWIIPVYPTMLFVDSILFNSIEFWSGSNPLNEPEKYVEGAQKK